MNFGFSIGKRSEEGRKDWKRYYDVSVVAGETAFQRLAEAARNTGAYTSVGFSERGAVNGTLYNSNAIFEPGGSYKVRRKLKPRVPSGLYGRMPTRGTSPSPQRRWGRSAA